VSIDWTSKKRKAFREALQYVYTDISELAMFVDEELNEKLAQIAGGSNLKDTAYKLIDWATSKDRINDLYQAFKDENPNHVFNQSIDRESLIPQTSNLTQSDWVILFEQFVPDDLADLQRAALKAYEATFGVSFRQVRPEYPPLTTCSQIQELLELYDIGKEGVVLAVRFVECAIVELQRTSSGETRNLELLQNWRSRIVQQFNIPPLSPEPTDTITQHAYLLVTLENHATYGERSSNLFLVYPELRLSGIEKPVGFGAYPKTCSIDQIADSVSEWIHQAEDILDDSCEAEVTLEIFLPYSKLEEDIARTWIAKNRRGEEISLGMHRRFVVRSSDRIRDRQIQRAMTPVWKRLKDFVEAGNAHDQFHSQTDCPGERGLLCALLRDNGAVGLKLLAPLPIDQNQRENLFKEIIDSAIPIALWTSETDEIDVDTLETEFSHLLAGPLTNFADLARRWRQHRIQPTSSKQIRILCDRPDRVPRLPDLINREDDDAIVA
jgi:hypothetical protein